MENQFVTSWCLNQKRIDAARGIVVDMTWLTSTVFDIFPDEKALLKSRHKAQ